ncbi:MAG: DUF3817 domain-containing protein [Alcaligenes nematophilus]|uniref:DUF3817 domain-containing protein n=1 Tax=Alcaligenes nematophilus TaxID=2994643 RepID=UPI003D082BC7
MNEPVLPINEGRRHERQQLRRLEIFSIIEAITLVLLVCLAVPLKHLYGWPLGSKILGPVHGIAFLAYIWTVVQTVSGGGWERRETVRLIVVAFLPFAGFFNVLWIRRKTADLADEGRI